MDVVFLGPPGAGKGTQAKMACKALELSHLSTGDLLRSAVADGTDLGGQAKAFMDRGELVPNALVGQLIEAELSGAAGKQGALFDGYPRNLEQAATLDAVEEKLGRTLGAVIALEVPDQDLEARLTGRRSCPSCGSMFHVANHPPKAAGICDVCGASLITRKDDNPEVIQARLGVYHSETLPLLERYAVRGLVRTVDGSGSIDEVHAAVRRALGEQ